MKPEDISKELFFVYGNEMQKKRIKLLNYSYRRKVSYMLRTRGTSGRKSMLTPRRSRDDSIKMDVERDTVIGSMCDSFGSRPVTERCEHCP